MSIFSNIANAAHTFVSWFETEVAKFQKNAPTVETFIEQGVAYATGVLKIVLAQVDANSPAAGILGKAIQDLLTLSAVAYDAGAHPSLASGFQDVVTNLSGLESATGIKNANSVATVGKVVNTLSAIISAVLAVVTAA
jgi:hypothetical protein